MSVDARKSKRKATLKSGFMTASANEEPSIPRVEKTAQRAVTAAVSVSSAKAGKQPKKRCVSAVKLKERDNRFTSPTFVRATEDSFGEIDFDPCWHAASPVQPDAYLDVRRGDNGLTDEWRGHVIFVNPPWSAAKKFLERAFAHWLDHQETTIICLVPSKTDTKFFHHVLSKHADVYFVEGRPIFSKEDKTSEGTAQSVMIVIFGSTPEQRVRFAKLVKGNWWLPPRPLFARTWAGSVDSPSCAQSYSSSSYAASPPHGGIFPTVSCTRIFERL